MRKSKVRLPAVAGTFYPADKKELQKNVENFLANVKLPKIKKGVKAVIVPHAGMAYSGQTAAYGYKALRERTGLSTFILLGPSHRVGFTGVAQDEHDFWETPLGKVRVRRYEIGDKGLGGGLIANDKRPFLAPENSLEVQLPFLQTIMSLRSATGGVAISGVSSKFTITPLLTGLDFDYEKLADVLKTNLDKKTAIIVSSDLSHYHSQNIAEKMDKKTIEAILGLDIKALKERECEACGKGGILAIVELAKKLGWRPKLLHYETSGDVTGDFSQVVGYASIGFYAV